MRKIVLALLLAVTPITSLTGCEAVGKMMAGPSKEKYADDYAEAWLELQKIIDFTQKPTIDQKQYARQLQAVEVEIRRYMADYAERPEAQSESYKTLFTIMGHYRHASDNWKNRKGALLVMQQFEEAESLFPTAREAFLAEYERPLDEVVKEVNLRHIAAYEAERAKQEALKKAEEAKSGKKSGGGH